MVDMICHKVYELLMSILRAYTYIGGLIHTLEGLYRGGGGGGGLIYRGFTYGRHLMLIIIFIILVSYTVNETKYDTCINIQYCTTYIIYT